MTRFQKLALATTLATFLLIAVGGFVRAAGAGLGCPDWPKCFDRWTPPTDISQLPPHIDPALFNFKLAWIEYINRLIGVVIGFLIFTTAIIAWRDHRHQRRIFHPTVAALLLVAFQGWFGGQVVRYELDPRFVTVHLFVALVIVFLLLYATLNGFFAAPMPLRTLPARRRRLALWTHIVIAVSLVQVVLGALVRGNIDLLIENMPQLARHLLLEEVGLLDYLHRDTGLLVWCACWVLVWCARFDVPTLRRTTLLTALLATVQFSAGLGLAYLALPPALQVVHIACGSLLLGGLATTALLATRLELTSA